MRKLNLLVLILSIVIAVLAIPVSSAQEEISTGCEALTSDLLLDGATFTFTGDFFGGESLTFTVDSDWMLGNTYTIAVNGLAVETDIITDTFTYVFPEFPEDVFDVSITVTVTAGTFTLSVSCDQAAGDGETGEFDGTICHYPPGNPAAAHTITVGSENAFQTHIDNHGDTPGACSADTESRMTDEEGGTTFFVLDMAVHIYGLCVDDQCSLLAVVDTTLFEGVDGFVIEFDENPEDIVVVRVFFLHELELEPKLALFGEEYADVVINVFQVNVYENDMLKSDDLLLFVDLSGNILAWGTHDIWDGDDEGDEGEEGDS